MKFILSLILAMASLNVFSTENLGYVCVPTNNAAKLKLAKLGSKIGEDYLKEIGVLLIRPETCADMHAMIYQDVCMAGPFVVAIGINNFSELTVRGNNKITLECQKDSVVYPFPVLGGSN